LLFFLFFVLRKRKKRDRIQKKEVTALQEPYSTARQTRELFAPIGQEIFLERYKNAAPTDMRFYHYHEVFELYYLYAGDRLYHISGKTYRIARGSFVLIRPFEVHGTSKASAAGYHRFLLHFSKDYLEDLILRSGCGELRELLEGDIHVLPVEFGKQSFVEALLLQMLEEYQNKPLGHESFLQAAATQLLLWLARAPKDGVANEEYNISAARKTVTEAIAYINHHYAEPLTLESIAEHHFVSAGYFSHTFKRIAGIPFVKYLNGIRILEAQRLLQQKNCTVLAAAEAAGYRSVTHFGRVFKEITGITPQEYKRKKSE
jgi:AraC-like DNA-binding protein/quercetin dioxygenase-like cupin family protein